MNADECAEFTQEVRVCLLNDDPAVIRKLAQQRTARQAAVTMDDWEKKLSIVPKRESPPVGPSHERHGNKHRGEKGTLR